MQATNRYAAVTTTIRLRYSTAVDSHSTALQPFDDLSNRDTCLAVVDMIDKVTEKLDAYNYSLGLFIDLSKAFDTL